VNIFDARLTAKKAGTGGNAAPGQTGQTEFGFGGASAGGGACQGGNGAPGSDGGPGGGGAGGIAAGVAYHGPMPTLSNTNIEKGTAGGKGLGGIPGMNDGIGGSNEAILAVD
jgi:hypothetical protein